jgi:hypothetical protein
VQWYIRPLGVLWVLVRACSSELEYCSYSAYRRSYGYSASVLFTLEVLLNGFLDVEKNLAIYWLIIKEYSPKTMFELEKNISDSHINLTLF